MEEWEKKQEAVKQVQELADQIAQATGIEGILAPEVNLLTRKLAEAKEIISPPPVEPAVKLRTQLIEAIQEKLDRVPEGSTTEQLISLRNSLLDLGKADAQLSSIASSSAPDVPLNDLLQLWEKAYRQTFKNYHQLSSQFAKTEDFTTVVNLWKDYLIHVRHFLDSELPQHYHELHEHNHLCQVHYTVLSSQKSLLPAESSALDQNTVQQLNLLTNMHNETLASIMEKQKQIESRITVWDKYRQDQTNLMDWLKNMEKERNQLKLRYIHSETIAKTIAKIEELLMRIAEGECLEMSLKEQLLTIIPFCDESVSSSLQIEQASLSHRLSNLHAALLTWKDYLEKVKSNIDLYEKHVQSVENSIDKIQNILIKENKFNVDSEDPKHLENKLQTIMTVSNNVRELSKEVESLEDAMDLLKDCLSPTDLKTMTQRCWLLSQQQNEFEHQLTIAEHVINDKLQISKVYDQRALRFLSWLSSMNHKLSTLPNDAASALSVVEREIRAEGIPKLAEEMDDLRVWIHEMETKLSTPIVLKQASKKFINSKIKEHKAIQDDIENKSTKVKDILKLCESLLTDCESCNITLDVEAITLAMASLESRWKNISSLSSQRKLSLENLIAVLEKAQKLAEEQKVWLKELDTKIGNSEKQLKSANLAMLPDMEENITKLVTDLNSGNSGGLSNVDAMYLSLHSEYKLPEEILKVPENLLKKWEELRHRANELSAEIRTRGTDREQWTRSAAKAVAAMAKVDALLTLAEVQESHEIEFEDQSVEVNTLRFETDQSTQVDTLGWSPPIARKGAFSEELIKTTEELEILLTNETLIDQCSASKEEALVDRIKYLGERFDFLRVSALKKQNQLRETSARGRLTCPLCSNKNWQQLDNDLWRLEQWLQYAEGSLSSQPSNPPSSIEQLEDVIQDQRELLLDLDSHRSLVVSMNIVGTHLAEHTEDEARAKELRNRLMAANKQWELVCELATAWQAKLQTALMQNHEFHDTMAELTEWLEKTETSIRQAEPIDLTDPTQIIQAKYTKFKEMHEEVERCEARVRSLEEAARQVLSDEDRAIERLGRLRLRLISLSRLISSYINSLSATLGQHPPADLSPLNLSQQLLDNASLGNEHPTSGDEVDTSTLVRCHRFLGRVMRASLPISAFLLLLLGAASFIPVVEQDFTCANSFLYNMAPVLRYPNGRPPT
ncbi:unnamed protein product [Nezara viridula]|uniref:KASH domain-containing protein n=1 Tax=Nezara viridula TaxID=85310 RepID=A0A9P0HKR5_NEZVI|nr:unnamed protein product [Nezara viridula]